MLQIGVPLRLQSQLKTVFTRKTNDKVEIYARVFVVQLTEQPGSESSHRQFWIEHLPSVCCIQKKK